MRKVLFVRRFKKPSGGQFKVRDYFEHCLHHPDLEPHLYFTPDSEWQSGSFWNVVPKDRIVREADLKLYDLVFLAGRDWEYVPEIPSKLRVINYIQHVKHADEADKRFQYLRKPAWRICVSEEVAEAISPFAVGEVRVIKNGIPLELFTPDTSKLENSILIWARKNSSLGTRLYDALRSQHRDICLLLDYLTREDFAQRLKQSDIFVALPHVSEGFYLPAIEAMASGCVVVCSDAVGNRSFCVHHHTCLMPAFDDADDHLRMIHLLLKNPELKVTLRQRGMSLAKSFSLESERSEFYRFLETMVFTTNAGAPNRLI